MSHWRYIGEIPKKGRSKIDNKDKVLLETEIFEEEMLEQSDNFKTSKSPDRMVYIQEF